MEPLNIRIATAINRDDLKEYCPGLFHGYTGISVFFYHLAKVTGNSGYQKIADDLVDGIFSDLNLMAPLDFEKGLAGIGWGIEYLVQNHFAEGNTDEILEEVDNKIFKLLNEETFTSFELTNGLSGYLFYLINRLKNKEPYDSMAKQINRELFILAVNKLYDLVTPQFPVIVKDFYFDLFWRFPVMLFALIEAYNLNIYNQKIICMIKQWLPNFEAYIPSLQINRLYMATVLKHIHSQIPEHRLEKQIKLLLFSTDFKALKSEIDPDLKSVRFGLPGFMIILDQAAKSFSADFPYYSDLLETRNVLKKELSSLFGSFSTIDFKSKQTMYGLSEGIAGLGLINILIPELTADDN